MGLFDPDRPAAVAADDFVVRSHYMAAVSNYKGINRHK